MSTCSTCREGLIREEKLVCTSCDESQKKEEKAAVAIQSAFRGYQTRKEIQNSKMASDEPTKEQLQAEFSADDKELCHAATKIQASFRGHQARKDTASSSNAKVEELSKDMQKMAQEEELDIDLTDPELHKAATKIQASFRGHKVRKEDADVVPK